MKKTYLILGLLLALLISFQILRSSFIEKVSPRIVDLAKFPFKAVTVPVKGLYSLAMFKNRYENKIALLESKISIFTKAFVEMKEIKEENRRLRALLSFKNKVAAASIPSEVIARNPSSWDTFVIVDKGRAGGLKYGMSVIGEQGLVGKIYEVGQDTATVMLIDNPNSKIGAAIQRTREQGVLIGLGGGLCKMIYLGYDTDVKPGDIVVVSDFSSVSLKGTLIGEVIKVLKNPQAVYASAVVKPSCNLFKIEEVLCVE